VQQLVLQRPRHILSYDLHRKPEPVTWRSGWYSKGAPGCDPIRRPQCSERIGEIVHRGDSSRD